VRTKKIFRTQMTVGRGFGLLSAARDRLTQVSLHHVPERERLIYRIEKSLHRPVLRDSCCAPGHDKRDTFIFCKKRRAEKINECLKTGRQRVRQIIRQARCLNDLHLYSTGKTACHDKTPNTY